MATTLTESAIKKAIKESAKTEANPGKRVDLADPGLKGLWLRITPTGAASWVLSCRDALGATRRFPLGQYPTMGISAARDAARATREDVRKGADPIAEAKRKRAIGRDAREGVGTLNALLDLYAKKQGNKLKTWDACRKMIENVFKAHLEKPLATMKLGDLQLTADSHKSQQSAAAAVRYLRPVLKWASHSGRGYAALELTLVRPPATVKRRDRVLSNEELGKLLPALNASDRPYASAMRFMLLTLTRRSEVTEARWGNIDLKAKTWTIPKTKNDQAHVVPLSRQALELLCARLPRDEKGYPLMDEDGHPLKPKASTRLFATSTGNALANWDRETKAIMQICGVTGWTRHDLRRTGATMAGNLGELPDIIRAALNHTSIHDQLETIYNKSRYRPQVALALQRLADALDGIEQGNANVVPLHQIRAN